MKAAIARKQEPVFDVNSIIAGAAKPKTNGSKSKVPEVSVPPETQELMLEVRKIKEEIESLESIFSMKEAQLIEQVSPLREDLCLQGYVSSIKIPDTENQLSTLSWKDAYSKVDIGNAETLSNIVGSKYPEYFATQLDITVRDTSEASLSELIQLVGPEQFAKFFEVERNIKPTPRYTTEFFTAFKPEERTALKSIVRQYKPALKVK